MSPAMALLMLAFGMMAGTLAVPFAEDMNRDPTKTEQIVLGFELIGFGLVILFGFPGYTVPGALALILGTGIMVAGFFRKGQG